MSPATCGIGGKNPTIYFIEVRSAGERRTLLVMQRTASAADGRISRKPDAVHCVIDVDSMLSQNVLRWASAPMRQRNDVVSIGSNIAVAASLPKVIAQATVMNKNSKFRDVECVRAMHFQIVDSFTIQSPAFGQ